MLETIVQKYENIKTDYKKEKAMRQLARAIEGSPIESTQTNIPYKAMAMFLMPAAAITASCATTAQETKKPETQKQTSEWSKPAPRPDSGFGDRIGVDGVGRRIEPHTGNDWIKDIGTPIIAAANGVISMSYNQIASGNVIWVEHHSNLFTFYAHLDKRFKENGEIVFRGMVIGESGFTGTKAGGHPHLHFELERGSPNIAAAIDLYKGYWTHGKKAYPYDGITDYDKVGRKTGNLLFSAPFVGPVPKGNIKLEQIIKAADVSDEKIKMFLSNPEPYKQQLFESSMSLIAKKSRKLAEDLAGLPILNDSISKDEALSVWKLYDAVKDESFPDNFGRSVEVSVLWSSIKDEGVNVTVKPLDHGLISSVKPYMLEQEDSYVVRGSDTIQVSSRVGPNDMDGIIIGCELFADGRLPDKKFALYFGKEEYIVSVSRLRDDGALVLRPGLDIRLLRERKGGSIVDLLGDMVSDSNKHKTKVGNKVYQWNFWLQELVRYGQEKDLARAFRAYSGLDGFVKDVLWKP